MKILLTASACTPFAGSENYFGWSAVLCLARRHDLWVITSGRNQPDLERAAAEGLIPSNVKFSYANWPKPWHSNMLKARLESWNEYRDFTKGALTAGRTLHRTVKFDLIHHVTIGTWRIGVPFWKLGIPFVWGPIGGGEQFPLQFYRILSKSGKAFELARTLSNWVSRCSPTVRACARNATHILAGNAETKLLLQKLRASESGVTLLSSAFYSASKIETFSASTSQQNCKGQLRIFAGGMIEGRKGVALAFAALARLKERGMDFAYL